MKIRLLLVCLALVVILAACSSNGGSGSHTNTSTNANNGGTTATEKPPVVITPTFTATGTDAAVYNGNMESLVENFTAYFAASGESAKVAAYDEPLSVSVANWYTPAMEAAMSKFGQQYGESMEANRWTDSAKRLYNLDVTHKWWAADADFNPKLRLDMTANDLPDVFIVRTQNDLIQLAESGAIWDLTDLMDTWATEDDKEVWASDGGALLEMASLDGRIYGLPNSISDTDNFSYLWIRSDWVDRLGLQYPTTMTELADLIEAFVNADMDGNGVKDTVGLVVDKALYYSARGLFNSFGAYPEIWVETNNGLQWGGTTESNKQALAFLAEQYKKGHLDKEFITKSGAVALESVLNGKAGVVYGGHWIGHTMGDLHELDPASNWRVIALPTGTGDVVKSPLNPSNHGWTAVSKKYANPEVAFKLRSLQSYTLKDKKADWWWYEENVAWNFAPTRANVSAFDNLFTYQNLMEAYNNNNDTSVLRAKAVPYWANLHGDLAWEWELMFGPGDHTPLSVLEDAYENDQLFYNAFLGAQSSFMQERWTTIRDEQLIAFTKIMIGEVGIEEGFAAWLNTFNNLGGEQITKEVNEWYSDR